MRFIINTQNSLVYKISKENIERIKTLVRNRKSYIKDTEQFVNKIRNIKLE